MVNSFTGLLAIVCGMAVWYIWDNVRKTNHEGKKRIRKLIIVKPRHYPTINGIDMTITSIAHGDTWR